LGKKLSEKARQKGGKSAPLFVERPALGYDDGYHMERKNATGA